MSAGKQYDYYVTNDMAMVAYLALKGHTAQDITMDDNVCRWKFVNIGDLMQCAEDFLGDRALVNPREYNRHFANTKKEFYRIQDRR